MADGTKNLKPQSTRTKEEQKKIATMGGKASGEARRRKRDLRLALEAILEKNIKTKDGQEMSGTEAIAAKLYEQALKGNVKAFEVLRDTVGQKPVDKVEQLNTNIIIDLSEEGENGDND